ncbi:hypothetical protein BUALT_Bualt05G0033900 [Buddleja alternifolia]|uniref:Uncharacterized protein n=1 Tax=Buddleja alternifolia TaxID=168488 RepID=A0AAV6XHQ8_9LAMI|nr:hypothetical protein BUALT_Bualt05G0033900 [Buddleja alternifolia]
MILESMKGEILVGEENVLNSPKGKESSVWCIIEINETNRIWWKQYGQLTIQQRQCDSERRRVSYAEKKRKRVCDGESSVRCQNDVCMSDIRCRDVIFTKSRAKAMRYDPVGSASSSKLPGYVVVSSNRCGGILHKTYGGVPH